MILNFFGRQIYVRKELLAAVVPVIVILLGFAGYVISSRNNAEIIETVSQAQPESEKSGILKESTSIDAESTEKNDDEIKVYIVGCVNNPGVVTLKKGDIIEDAIRLAGGMTEQADPRSVNLAYKIKDNVMLYIKSRDEMKDFLEKDQRFQVPGEAGEGAALISDSGGAVIGDTSNDKNPKKININTSSASELETLPGVGKETAKDIIDFREKNGSFKSVNDIMKISGIKDSRFSKIKDLITVD